MYLESLERRCMLSADGLSAESSSPAIVGDLDLNGHVGFPDFVIMARHMGRRNARPEMGDLDLDQVVGFSDFMLLARNFNSGKAHEAPRGKPEDVPRGPRPEHIEEDTEDQQEEHGKPNDVSRCDRADHGGDADAEAEAVEVNDEDGGKPDDVPRCVKPDPDGDETDHDDTDAHGRPDDVPRGPKEKQRSIAEIDVHVNDAGEIFVSSSKDISNIVYAVDEVFTKLEGLDGRTFVLDVSGVTDIWIKSGNNASGDGPGYGQHFDIP